MSQARIDRQKFSNEGFIHDQLWHSPSSVNGAKTTPPPVVGVEKNEILKAATEDLQRIFEMKVRVYRNSEMCYDFFIECRMMCV